jgi:hypothetical protein
MFAFAQYVTVHAVRGGPLPDNNLIANGNGTVTDTSTGLMWQQATAPGKYTWQGALAYCENLTLAGHSDWRLPTWKELLSIADHTRYEPSIDTTAFPGTVYFHFVIDSYYWTSTTSPNSSLAVTVDFVVGEVGSTNKSGGYYVRAVRNVGSTATCLSSFSATPKSGRVFCEWRTESEIDNSGFNLYRSASADGEYVKINDALIPAEGSSTQGAAYEFIDKDVKNRKTYYYKLEDIDLNGSSTMHGPMSATPRWIYGIFKK